MALLRYSELEPHPALGRHILCYWEFAASEQQAAFMHQVMPDGCLVVAYARRGSAAHLQLVGPSQDGFKVPVEPGDQVWGIRFWPDAAGALLSIDPGTLRGYHGPASLVLPGLATSLIEKLDACRGILDAARVFDTVLSGHLLTTCPLDGVTRRAVEVLVAAEGQCPIHELAQELGYSERQLQRRFQSAVGLTPKQFARIRRLRSAVANAMHDTAKGWGRVAAEQGFADQAHLIREFSQLTGESPTTFLERIRAIDHVNVTP